MRYFIFAVVLLARVLVAHGSYAGATVPKAVSSASDLDVTTAVVVAASSLQQPLGKWNLRSSRAGEMRFNLLERRCLRQRR